MLPPPPPASLFDVRFLDAGGRSALVGGEGTVALQGVEGVVLVQTEGLAEGARLTLRDAAGALIGRLGPGETVSARADRLRVSLEHTPSALALEPVSPNPVRAEALLRYALPAPGPVRLSVYDALGREVAVLRAGPEGAGFHAVRFETAGLAQGAYVVRLHGAGRSATQTVVVVR